MPRATPCDTFASGSLRAPGNHKTWYLSRGDYYTRDMASGHCMRMVTDAAGDDASEDVGMPARSEEQVLRTAGVEPDPGDDLAPWSAHGNRPCLSAVHMAG